MYVCACVYIHICVCMGVHMCMWKQPWVSSSGRLYTFFEAEFCTLAWSSRIRLDRLTSDLCLPPQHWHTNVGSGIELSPCKASTSATELSPPDLSYL